MTEESRAPRRLAESPGRSGDLIRQVLSEPGQSSSLPRFSQLQERRSSRSRIQTAALLAAAVVVLGLGVRSLRPQEPVATVSAEPLLPPTPAPSASVSVTTESAPPVDGVPTKSLPKRDGPSKARAAAVASSPRGVAPALSASAMPTPGELHGGAKACAEMARSGSVDHALECYEVLANGSGVTAELALFEQARLAGKALRKPARALALLDAYRQRFPNGSLRAEAMLASIEWALAAGDTARARAGVEEALASGLLNERRAELTRLLASLDGHPVTAPR